MDTPETYHAEVPTKPKKPDVRSILTTGVFLVVIGGLFLAGRIVPSPAVLAAERRAPAHLPALTVGSVLSAQFMSGFETYAADTFPLRSSFQTVHAASVVGLFAQSDKSGLFMADGSVSRVIPDDTAAMALAGDKINKVAQGLAGLNLYYGVIPDKAIFAGRHLPGVEPGRAMAVLAGRLDGLTALPLDGALDVSSFYRTDLHWDQAKLQPVVDALGATMGFTVNLGEYSTRDAGSFVGAYGSQWALPVTPDRLAYLDDPALTASYLDPVTQTMVPGPVYDPAAITAVDPYNVFLRGPQPLIVLTNPAATTDRELFLFRDSFGSSLAPLLAGAYAKVTLIDLRYISASVLGQFVDFTPGADALFLFSSQILNNASILRV